MSMKKLPTMPSTLRPAAAPPASPASLPAAGLAEEASFRPPPPAAGPPSMSSNAPPYTSSGVHEGPCYRGGAREGMYDSFPPSHPPFQGEIQGGTPPMYYPRGYRGGGGGYATAYPPAGRPAPPPRDPTNTVWVGNLEPMQIADQDALRAVFSEFGVVMRIAPHVEHRYCFVHFRRVEEAVNAVNTLRERNTLGAARFNYGKMFEYTAEEMQAGYVPSSMPSGVEGRNEGSNFGYNKRFRDDDGGEDGYNSRRPRRDQKEPTNVLWVGSLQPYITDDRLREFFSVCGNVKMVSRMDRNNMAFIHFETVEDATLALETLRGKPIDGQTVLPINYGHAQRSREIDPTAPSGAPGMGSATGSGVVGANEVPTNVVYLGQLPPNVTEDAIDELFSPYEGFISSKLLSANNFAFGHFDSIETATAARIGLHNCEVCGVPIRVSYGRSNHSLTMADKVVKAGAIESGSLNLDELMRDPASLQVGGALMPFMAQTNALVLPAAGGSSGLPGGEIPIDLARERAAPELNLRARLQSVMGSTYNGCGAEGLRLTPTEVRAVCIMIDRCINQERADQLAHTFSLFLPLQAAHVFNISTKRIRDHYLTDTTRKLLILFAATKVLLKTAEDAVQQRCSEEEFVLPYHSASLNAYLMLLLTATEHQPREGLDRLITIMDGLENNQERRLFSSTSSAENVEVLKRDFYAQLKEIRASAQAEQDLLSIRSLRRKKKE